MNTYNELENIMNRSIVRILLTFLCLNLLIISCDDNDIPIYEFPITVTLSQHTIDANLTNPFSVEIHLSDMDKFTKMEIYKQDRKGNSLIGTVDKTKFENSTYTFSYRVTEKDDDTFSFSFKVFADSKSTLRTLYVNNKYGLMLSNLTMLSRVTGKSLANETLPNINTTHLLYELSATDLGIIWEIEPGKVGIFFGDSYGGNFVPGDNGGPNNGTDWRANVLAFSENKNLDDGLIFSGMAMDSLNSKRAREIIPRWKYKSFTSIPTSAIEIQGVQYVHFMNWQVFGGEEHLNYSSIYKSTDKGLNWSSCEDLVKFPANSLFGQIGYAKRDGYVYMIGTPIGRKNSARLARFLEKDILNHNQYEYWNGIYKKWMTGSESLATVILDGTVGEMSVMYLEKYQKWLILYFDEQAYAICYRTASELNGEWSKERVLASGNQYPQLYGSYMHPFSNNDDTIYFTMSLWWQYNVFFMRANIVELN